MKSQTDRMRIKYRKNQLILYIDEKTLFKIKCIFKQRAAISTAYFYSAPVDAHNLIA